MGELAPTGHRCRCQWARLSPQLGTRLPLRMLLCRTATCSTSKTSVHYRIAQSFLIFPKAMSDIPLSQQASFNFLSCAANVPNSEIRFHLQWSTIAEATPTDE